MGKYDLIFLTASLPHTCLLKPLTRLTDGLNSNFQRKSVIISRKIEIILEAVISE